MSEPTGPPSLADSDFTLQFGESVIVEFIRGHTAADIQEYSTDSILENCACHKRRQSVLAKSGIGRYRTVSDSIQKPCAGERGG